MPFVHQLKERKIQQTLVIYLGGGWVLIEALNFFVEKYGWNAKIFDIFIIIAIFGLPAVLIYAWFHGKSESRNIQQRELLLHAIILLLASVFVVNVLIQSEDVEVEIANQNVIASEKSIAVMPFDDMSPDKDQEWFSDGLSEEILNSLFQVEELELRGKSSSFAFKGKGLTIKKLADTLNVNYVLEGSVRKIDDNLRITTQLIRANDDVHIWSETFNRKYDELFEVQTEIANKIARALNIILDDSARENLAVAGTKNIEAYQYLLRGKKLFNDFHNIYPRTFTLWKANEFLDKALALDSTIGIAYYLKADAYNHYVYYTMPGPEDVDLSIKNAIELQISNYRYAISFIRDEAIQLILNITLHIHLNDWSDIPQIASDFISNYKPSYLITSQFVNDFIYLKIGQEGVFSILNKEITNDPYNPFIHLYFANIYIHSGNLSEAKNVLDKAENLGITSNNDYARSSRLLLRLMMGESKLIADSLKNSSDVIAINFGKALLGQVFDPQIDLDNLDYESWQFLRVVWIYWELGEVETANNLISKFDNQLSEKNYYKRFFEKMGFRFSYYIPFDIDAAPNFKARLIEAGIDPNKLKSMPRFSLKQ